MSVLALMVSILSLFVTYLATRYQLKLFIHNILAIKAKEATDYIEKAIDKISSSEILNNNFLHCISSIIQGWQMVEKFMKSHSLALFYPPREEFEDFFYLHLSTTIKFHLFQNNETIYRFLHQWPEKEKEIIVSQLNEVLRILHRSHHDLDPNRRL